MPAALDVPSVPAELQYLWDYFISMNRKRTVGAMCANPLSDEQISAWERRHRVTLSPFEQDCIDELDQAFLIAHVPKKQKDK